MAHKISRAILTFLALWFAGVTVYVVAIARFYISSNDAALGVLGFFAILSVITTGLLYAIEDD